MLLPNEQQAKDFVLKIGEARAERLLNLVGNRITRRADKGNAECPTMYFNEGTVRKAQWEVDLMFNTKMGLTLTNNQDNPIAAKARIAARIAARNAKRQERNTQGGAQA